MLKIIISETAYPKQIHGAIYNVIPCNYHGKKPMFSIYVNDRTEMMFLNDDDGLAVWDAIQAKKFVIGDIPVQNAMVESMMSVDKIDRKPMNRITIRFLSPTTIRKGSIHLPLPEPINVFRNAVEILDAQMPEIFILDLHIKTAKIAISPRIIVSGFVGTCTFKCQDPWFLYPAARILEYTGVGWKPALGMGRVAVVTEQSRR